MGKSDETGNCSKCAHSEEIRKAREANDEKAILALRKTCLKCIRGCDRCSFGKRKAEIELYIAALEKGVGIAELESESNGIRKNFCSRCKERKCQFCNNGALLRDIKTTIGAFSKFREDGGDNGNGGGGGSAQDRIARARDIYDGITVDMCYKCTRSPASDDNPSRGGKEFVSFDAAEDPDTIMPFADPCSPQYRQFKPSSDFRDSIEEEAPQPQQRTNLPHDVEETLRRELCNLCGKLDHVDRALVFFLMNGGTLTDFGKMRWVPQEFFSTMSKQCVYARYKKIVREVPVLSAVAHGMIGKGKGGGAKPRKGSGSHLVQQELFADGELG